MFCLMLTREERDAIEWIGYRYSHGDDLFDALQNASGCILVDDMESAWKAANKDEAEWDGTYDIDYWMSQATALEVKAIIDGSLLDCFATEFCTKLREFSKQVV